MILQFLLSGGNPLQEGMNYAPTVHTFWLFYLLFNNPYIIHVVSYRSLLHRIESRLCKTLLYWCYVKKSDRH